MNEVRNNNGVTVRLKTVCKRAPQCPGSVRARRSIRQPEEPNSMIRPSQWACIGKAIAAVVKKATVQRCVCFASLLVQYAREFIHEFFHYRSRCRCPLGGEHHQPCRDNALAKRNPFCHSFLLFSAVVDHLAWLPFWRNCRLP